jgi:cyclase
MTPRETSTVKSSHFDWIQLTDRVCVAVEPGGGSNAGVFLGEKGPVIVDALLSPLAGEALQDTVAEISSLPPRALIYTHHHGDHTFGGQAFECPAIAHIAASEAMRNGGPELSPSRLLNLFYGEHFGCAIANDRPDTEALKKRFLQLDLTGLALRPPEVTFTKRLTLHDPLGTVEVIHAGHAHSAGDVVVFLPKEKVLFTGDLAFSGRMPFMADPIGRELFQALDRMEGVKPDTVVPGHGPPGGPEILRTMQEFFSDLRDAVATLHSQGRSLEEVKAEITLPKYADWPRYNTALPLNAEMAYLGFEAEGRESHME